MKTKCIIYLAVLVVEVLLGFGLNSFISGTPPPTAPATAEELTVYRHALAESETKPVP